jgi:hypothetical protein
LPGANRLRGLFQKWKSENMFESFLSESHFVRIAS